MPEDLVKELELSYAVHKFVESLAGRGYGQCEVCIALLKETSLQHFHFAKEHYEGISDGAVIKTFESCANHHCSELLHSLKRGF